MNTASLRGVSQGSSFSMTSIPLLTMDHAKAAMSELFKVHQQNLGLLLNWRNTYLGHKGACSMK